MSKKKNRLKKQDKIKEYKVSVEISDIVKSLQLSSDNMEELGKRTDTFLKSSGDFMSEIFLDQDLTLSQKMLMSYVKGSADNPKAVKEQLDMHEQFLDIDNAEKFAHNFFDYENFIKFMRNILGIVTMTLEISISDVEAEIARTTGEEEKIAKTILLEKFRSDQIKHNNALKKWESDIEKWKVTVLKKGN